MPLFSPKIHFDRFFWLPKKLRYTEVLLQVSSRTFSSVTHFKNIWLGGSNLSKMVLFLTIWLFNIAMERSTIFKFGKPSINGPFSMAMLNNQRINPPLPGQTLWKNGYQHPKSSWVYDDFVLKLAINYPGWWLTYPSEKYESQWEGLSHILWKIKDVWNHQPVSVTIINWFWSPKHLASYLRSFFAVSPNRSSLNPPI